MLRLSCRGAAALAAASAVLGGEVRGQAAVDPNVAPRAAALERAGERRMAIGLLGRYLATAPDDGRAWFQLGRFYLLDARDWHLQGHRGDPDGLLYLDFAATAFDQAVRLSVDSGAVFRGLAELERSVVSLEDSGWAAGGHMRSSRAPALPGFILELGANLLSSCPVGGVLLVGSDLEALSVWYDNVRPSRPEDPADPARSVRHRFLVPPPHRRGDGHRCPASYPDGPGAGGRAPATLSLPYGRQRRSAAGQLDHIQAGPRKPSFAARTGGAVGYGAPHGHAAGRVGVGSRRAPGLR